MELSREFRDFFMVCLGPAGNPRSLAAFHKILNWGFISGR